jgi:hypothetical protein
LRVNPEDAIEGSIDIGISCKAIPAANTTEPGRLVAGKKQPPIAA